MQVRCPKCQETLQAKANARRIKCPSCGFREEAPEGGFGAAWAAGKPKTEFRPLERPGSVPAQSAANPALVWGAVAVVAILVIAGAWYLTRGPGGGGSTTSTTTTGTGNVAGTACDTPLSGMTLDDPTDPVVEIRTSAGCMAAELFAKKAPITTENFLTYVHEGYYSQLHFYRIVPNFVNQAGGGGDHKNATHDAIKNEAISSGLHNAKYTLAMARLGAACADCPDQPDSATSEFYINAADNTAGHQNNLDPGGVNAAGYAVFGRLIHGQAVSDAINGMSAPPGPTLDFIREVAKTESSSTTQLANPMCASFPNAPLPAPGPVEVDFITPGVWNVCSDQESQYVWVHNNGTSSLTYTLSITGAGGAPLPAGWTVSFAQPTATLSVGGAVQGAWKATMATLTIPASEGARDVPAELHAGGATRAFTFHVQAQRGRVTAADEHIQTHYDLDDNHGTAVQHNGDFCVTLGTHTNAVQGYAWGLIGLAKGETVTLYVPPPFAYGYGTQGLAGKTLVWTATIMGYSPTPPDPTTAQCPDAV